MPSPKGSVLLITLDSCRFDTFKRIKPKALTAIGKLHRAMAPSHFTYGSHAAMWMGFLPSIREARNYLNSKYRKLFRIEFAGSKGKSEAAFALRGGSIVEGFKNNNYLTIGSGAVGWFNPRTASGKKLTDDFDEFYYPGTTWQLCDQLEWMKEKIKHANDKPIFAFLNIGETHVPYWHEGANWNKEDNPCIPFQRKNRRRACWHRQGECLKYIDNQISPILKAFEKETIVVTADHGDCWGENGLWEHGISHRRTLEVPLIVRLNGNPI